jgi:hypothetical protein
MSEKIRKTTRKNKTNQIMNWPSNDDYFTIDSLILSNKHMLTNSGSDITLRVKLMKAVNEEPKTVVVIGTTNTGKGRPQLVFAMCPVKPEVLEKAKLNKITLESQDKLISVMEVNPKAITQTPTQITPVKIIEDQTVKV